MAITYQIATNLDEVLSLRHDAFVAEGQIAPLPNGQLVDDFDENGRNYVLWDTASWGIVAAVRLHVLEHYTDWSPAYEAFPEVIGSLLLKGKKVLDTNRLVTAPASRGFKKLNLYNQATRIGFMAVEYFGIHWATMTVREEHCKFYAREMMAEELAPLRPYPLLKSPICLMGTDMSKHLGAILEKNPRWRSDEVERKRAFE